MSEESASSGPGEREAEVGVRAAGGTSHRDDRVYRTGPESCVEGALWVEDEDEYGLDGGMCCFACILCGERCEMDHGTLYCYECWRASLDA